ncbi:hypothetical protein LOTGIDRAFT_171138 [Lottia gigantea]|uniref:SMB domain-containing protein n=1 Tax=Lottia gigantea TaxID=225164 RepID=V4B0L9_LOTGI|nr:hypothetical protein LOTGIDRAFT_171138 [Lottia gigantea]ESP03708.1 hypothetical protein LOTGIDRAFT_171138 [Lottia gigantea]
MLGLILFFQWILTSSSTDWLSVNNNSHADSLVGNNSTRSDHIENTCFNFNPQSCSGVCGQFFELWCSCDEYCQVYRRCCFDYEAVCKEESEIYRSQHENLMNVSTECDSNISGYVLPQQIITSCSLSNYSLTTVELCKSETRSSAVVSKVMSNRTGLHYKNRYCMLCNGEKPDDVVYWSTMVGTTDRKDRIRDIQHIINFFQNSIQMIPPPNSEEIICFPELISTCEKFASPEESRLCKEKALSPIRYKTNIYKNTFCLQCNVVLSPNNNSCFMATKTDIFYGHYEQSLVFSIVLNWKNNRQASISIHSHMSLIESLSCSLDSQDNIQTCKIQKCVGTLPVVNDTCLIGENHIGCIRYFFKMNFTIPMDISSEQVLEHISSKLVQVATNLERAFNVTKYYSQNVALHDITIVNDHVFGYIILDRMAYSLCDLDFKSVKPERYFEYLDNNLFINLRGSIVTCRFTVACISWCDHWSENELKCSRYQRSFTGNFSDIASFSTKMTPIHVFILFLIHLYGIVVAD